MRAASVLLGVALIACSNSAAQTGSPAGAHGSSISATSFCEVLANVSYGQNLPVTISGIFVTGMESQVLYDPEEPRCHSNVQPATWVEFAPAADVGRLDRALERADRAFVSFRGVLFGPQPMKPDDPSYPLDLAGPIRLAGRGYGHMTVFRTKLVVDEVLDAKPVPASFPRRVEWISAPPEPLPRVLSAELPNYPRAAQVGGLTGNVEIHVAVKDGSVVETKLVAGDRLLASEAIANIRTWRFEPRLDAAFTTRFVYQLERREVGADSNPRVEVQFPTSVRIVAPTFDW